MFMTLLILSITFRLYAGVVKDYYELVQFFKHTDYAYHAFEVLKIQLYNHVETMELQGNVLTIQKSSIVPGKNIRLQQRDRRLIFVFDGGTIQEVCHDVTKVNMRREGQVLYIELVFPSVTYERGFYIAP